MSGNGQTRGYSHSLTPDQVWDIYDRLPLTLKRFIQRAPLKASPVAVANMFNRSNSEDETLETLEYRMRELVSIKVAEDYGDHHPQAELL